MPFTDGFVLGRFLMCLMYILAFLAPEKLLLRLILPNNAVGNPVLLPGRGQVLPLWPAEFLILVFSNGLFPFILKHPGFVSGAALPFGA